MCPNPKIHILYPSALGKGDDFDILSRFKLYYDITPFLRGYEPGTSGFQTAADEAKKVALKEFGPIVITRPRNGNDKPIISGRFRSTSGDAEMPLLYALLHSYPADQAGTIIIPQNASAMTTAQLKELEDFAFLNHAEVGPLPYPSVDELEQQRVFTMACDIIRKLFYLKTLDDDELGALVQGKSRRFLRLDRQRISISKELVFRLALEASNTDKSWERAFPANDYGSFTIISRIFRKYAAGAGFVYATRKIQDTRAWDQIGFSRNFGEFVGHFREISRVLNSPHIFPHHNAKMFAAGRLYSLDLDAWPQTEPPRPHIDCDFLEAVSSNVKHE